MGSQTEQTSYDIYLKTTSKREIWRLSIKEFDTTDHAEVTAEVKSLTTNDKEELQELNNRLSEYIKKVQSLEDSNKGLESELNHLRKQPARIDKIIKEQLKILQEEVRKSNAKMSELKVDLNIFKAKYEKEVTERKNVEKTLEEFKTKERTATTRCVDMETNVKSLMDEMDFLEKVIEELSGEQKSSEHVKRTDELRQKYEKEVTQYKREAETTKTELETLTITKATHVKKLEDTVTKLNEKIAEYKTKIDVLKTKLTTTETKMTTQLSAYEELSSVNVKLDEEIRKYRQLLEDGESYIKEEEDNEEGNEDDEKEDDKEDNLSQ